MESVILAGGLGTRLQQVIKDIPKPMALINKKPFLEYLFDYLIHYKVDKFILSVGFKYEAIEDYFGKQYKNIPIEYAVEDEPLGTGGGIKKAFGYVAGDSAFVINGDTLFDIDLNNMLNFHKNNKSDVTIALRQLDNVCRYGTVKINESNRIIGFAEKNTQAGAGCINGGTYIINKKVFETIGFPEKFSFEKDFMEKYCESMNIYGLVFDDYFLDIGIPEDYEKAQDEFKRFAY